MTATEREIWVRALEVVERFGDAASFHAASRADARLAKGDLDGERTWIKVWKAVEQLQRLKPPASERMT